MPPRSYPTSLILKKYDNNIIEKKISYLQNIPQPDQRTDEWYHFRHKYITASSAWKAFSNPTTATYNQLIYDKCKPINIEKYTKNVSTATPMHWGQKYEDVSIMWYENTY